MTLRALFAADPAMQGAGRARPISAQLTGSPASLIGARVRRPDLRSRAAARAGDGGPRHGRAARSTRARTSIRPRQIEQAELRLYRVAEQGGDGRRSRASPAPRRSAAKQAEKAHELGRRHLGVTSGLTDSARPTGGSNRSDLLILAGRPGMGKTSLATNIAFNAAERWRATSRRGSRRKSIGAPVAFFSLEMSADQLATRILSEQAEDRLGEAAHRAATQPCSSRNSRGGGADLEQLPLSHIDDTLGLTIAALRTRARRMKRQQKIGMIIVDYLQLLTAAAKAAGDGRVQEISEISRGSRRWPRNFNVPVLALSQLSRAVESREDKRPQLSDLRESGSIEQDADIVLFVYRDEYYHRLQGAPRPPTATEPDEERWRYAASAGRAARRFGQRRADHRQAAPRRDGHR